MHYAGIITKLLSDIIVAILYSFLFFFFRFLVFDNIERGSLKEHLNGNSLAEALYVHTSAKIDFLFIGWQIPLGLP